MQKNVFNIGDEVALINDTTKGVITSIDNEIITITSDDDFEYKCTVNEITKTGNLHSYLNNSNHDEFLKENLSEKRDKNIPKKSFPKNKTPPMEVDLHIHKLVKNTKGMSNFDMLNLQINTAKRQLEFAIHKKIQRIVFIHGIGDGVLRSELHYLLKKYPVKTSEASYQKYGQGATEVYIFQNG